MAASSQAGYGSSSCNGDDGGPQHDCKVALAVDAPSTAIAMRHRGMHSPAMSHRPAGYSSPPSPPPLPRCEASSRLRPIRLRASRSAHHLPGLAVGRMPSSCSTGHLPLFRPTSRLHIGTGSGSSPRIKGSTTPRLLLRQQQKQHQRSSSSPTALAYNTLMMLSPSPAGHWLTSSCEEARPAVLLPVSTTPQAIQWEADMRYYARSARSECEDSYSPRRNRQLPLPRRQHEGRVGESPLLRFQACDEGSVFLRSASLHNVQPLNSSNSSNNLPPSRWSRHNRSRSMLSGTRLGKRAASVPNLSAMEIRQGEAADGAV